MYNDIYPKEHWIISDEATSRARILAGIFDAETFYGRPSIVDFVDVKGRVVLDLGCGIGRIARRVAERGASQYVGVDSSPTMLGYAAKNHEDIKEIRFLQNDGVRLPADSSSVDVVVAELLFQHCPKDVISGYFSEVARVLRGGGQFIANIPREGTFVCGFNEEEVRSFFPGYDLRYFEDPTIIWYLQLLITKGQ